MNNKHYPNIYQLPVRPYLYQNNLTSLKDIPNSLIDFLVKNNFNTLYLLGVWTLSDFSLSCDYTPDRQNFYKSLLPDLAPEDIIGSPFAITSYVVNPKIGTDAQLLHLKKRLNARNITLMLDFVPNHGSVERSNAHPEQFMKSVEIGPNQHTNGVFYGRDRHFTWADTAQFDLSSKAAQQAIFSDLQKVATLCDGVRCDMAMLLLPEVFSEIWGVEIDDFWRFSIAGVKKLFPEFVFVAEVYWGFQQELVDRGFDFCYCKKPLERSLNLQGKCENACSESCCHFLENHDENRISGSDNRFPACLNCYFRPGARFFFWGQMEGFKKRLEVQLRRAETEHVDRANLVFYERILAILGMEVFQGEFEEIKSHLYVFQCIWRSGDQRVQIAANLSDEIIKIMIDDGKYVNLLNKQAVVIENGLKMQAFQCLILSD